MFSRKIRVQIGALVIVASLTYMLLQGAHNFSSYFVTVRSFRATAAKFGHHTVRVEGVLAARSVHYNKGTGTLLFTLHQGSSTMAVRYRGAMPNERFRNANAIVKGHLESNGVFEADKLEIQCPNHYGPSHGVRQ